MRILQRLALKITLKILIIDYFQPSVGLIIPETSLSLNSKQNDVNEINLTINEFGFRII